MNERVPSRRKADHVNRRSFLRVTGTALATLLVGVGPAARVVYATALTEAQRAKMTPEDIIAPMKSGNDGSGRQAEGSELPGEQQARPRASIPRR